MPNVSTEFLLQTIRLMCQQLDGQQARIVELEQALAAANAPKPRRAKGA